jgi:hypothetical protein
VIAISRVDVDCRSIAVRRSVPEATVANVQITAVVAYRTAITPKNSKKRPGPKKSRPGDLDLINCGVLDVDSSTDAILEILENGIQYGETGGRVMLDPLCLVFVLDHTNARPRQGNRELENGKKNKQRHRKQNQEQWNSEESNNPPIENTELSVPFRGKSDRHD